MKDGMMARFYRLSIVGLNNLSIYYEDCSLVVEIREPDLIDLRLCFDAYIHKVCLPKNCLGSISQLQLHS